MPRWLAITAVVLSLVFAAPFVLGTLYATIGLSGFAVVCGEWKDVLKGKVPTDSYRAFLTNRGCNFDEVIADILRDELGIDDASLVTIVKGAVPPRNTDDLMRRDAVLSISRTFRPIVICRKLNVKTQQRLHGAVSSPQLSGPESGTIALINGSLQTVNECYRGMHPTFNEDIIGAAFNAITSLYGSFFIVNFNQSMNAVVDLIGGLGQTGPLMPWIMIMVALSLIWGGKLLLDGVRDWLKDAFKKRLGTKGPDRA